MASSSGDFQGALHRFLPLDLGEVQFPVRRMVENLRNIHFYRRYLDLAFQEADRLTQIPNGNDLQAGNHGRFRRILRGHQDADFAFRPRPQGDGQDAFDGTHRAREGKFAHHHEILQLVGFELLAGCCHADCDG